MCARISYNSRCFLASAAGHFVAIAQRVRPILRRELLATLLAALGACAPEDASLVAPRDASVDDADEVAMSGDATGADALSPPDVTSGADAVAPSDVVSPADAVSIPDVPFAQDALALDAPAPRDVPAAMDGGAPRDVPAAMDAGTPRDVVAAPDVTSLDAGVTDVLRPDVVDAPAPPRDAVVDTGAPCTVAARVVSPAPNEVIETCTESGTPVYYAFTAEVTGDVARVDFAWRTPRGDLAPPPPPALTAAPFSMRRQVGGMMTDVPPLGVFPDALRGTWRFEVTVTDRCGRSAVTAQPFSLTFTTRRCPNP